MIHRWALRKIANCPKWCYRFCKERKAYIVKKRREGIAFAAKGVFREVCGTSLSFHPNVTIPSLRIPLFSKQCVDFHTRDLWIWLMFSLCPIKLGGWFFKIYICSEATRNRDSLRVITDIFWFCDCNLSWAFKALSLSFTFYNLSNAVRWSSTTDSPCSQHYYNYDKMQQPLGLLEPKALHPKQP